MTRFHGGDYGLGHAPGHNKNEADSSRATKTGQVDELATFKREAVDWVATSGPRSARLRPNWGCMRQCFDDG
jgi:hypothetical protein